MQARRDQIAARADSPKYIEWVWSTNFNTWLQSSESFYWITGCPGSGKSTLMKHISESRKTLNALQASGERWTPIHFFFDFRAKITTANTIDGMLRSLLYQIAKRLPEVVKHLEFTLGTEISSQHDVHNYMDNLCDAVQHSSTKICAFIDGLDEFDGPGSDLLEAIYSLEDRSGIKICMASRPYLVFEDSLSSYQHLIMQDHNYQSIQLYTEAQFNSNRIVGAASLPHQVADKIRVKARGVFLWARLATDELLRDFLAGVSATDLEHRLDQMPAEVEEMYQRILNRLPKVHKIEAALLLYILLVSRGYVEVRELFIAMDRIALKLTPRDCIQQVDEDSDNDRRLLALLGDFVDVLQDDDDNVGTLFTFGKTGVDARFYATSVSYARLTHETLHAFLTNNKWLEEVLCPNLTITYASRFWFDLYLDELVGCVKRGGTMPAEFLEKHERFLRESTSNLIGFYHYDLEDLYSSDVEGRNKDDTGTEAVRGDLNKVRTEAVVLLRLWEQWTPLLPYALRKIFEELENLEFPGDERIDDMQQFLQSPVSWLHQPICVVHELESAVMEDRPLLDRCFKRHGILEDIMTLDPRLTIPLCHSMSSYLAQAFCKDQCSILPAVRQPIFDLMLTKDCSMEEQNWEGLLVALARTDRYFTGKHLCKFFTTFDWGEKRWHSILELLRSRQDTQNVLSEHQSNCEFYGSQTPEVGFLCHWADRMLVTRPGTEEDIKMIFEAISIDKGHLSQIADPNGEPLLNVIIQSPTLQSPGARQLKVALALQAGANPHVAGKSGTAFDVVKAQFESFRKFDDSPPSKFLIETSHELKQIMELLNYHVRHNGVLPEDLIRSLTFSTRLRSGSQVNEHEP